jgi:hypothetical protein
MKYVLSVDTGKHFAAALLGYQDRGEAELVDMYYQHKEAFMTSEVNKLASSLGEMLNRHSVHPQDLTLVVELPSHRYFGRGNSSALLKAFWQGLRLMFRFAGKCESVVPVPANKWNRQRDDQEKKQAFLSAFPDFKQVHYYQNKHGSRSNDHERDATLFGQWAVNRIQLDIPFSFS